MYVACAFGVLENVRRAQGVAVVRFVLDARKPLIHVRDGNGSRINVLRRWGAIVRYDENVVLA